MKTLSRRKMVAALAAAAGAIALGARSFGLRRGAAEREALGGADGRSSTGGPLSRGVTPATHSVKRHGSGRASS